MNTEQQTLLEAIREFKSDDQTELEAALNLCISHAATIKRCERKISSLESVLDMIWVTAKERRLPDESNKENKR